MGPASIRPGFDIAAQAESGMMSLNGEQGRDPVRVGFTVVDVLAAQMLTSGVLAALLRRGTTGRGGLVDLSLVDVAIAALANQWTEYALTGRDDDAWLAASDRLDALLDDVEDGLAAWAANYWTFPRNCATSRYAAGTQLNKLINTYRSEAA